MRCFIREIRVIRDPNSSVFEPFLSSLFEPCFQHYFAPQNYLRFGGVANSSSDEPICRAHAEHRGATGSTTF